MTIRPYEIWRLRYIYSSLNAKLPRYFFIVEVINNNWSNCKTAEILGISASTVKNVIEYCDYHMDKPITKQGRPVKLTDMIKNHILSATYCTPDIAAIDIVAEVLEIFGVQIGKSTINNYRQKMGLVYGPRVKETLQTPLSLTKRLAFARYHISAETDWKTTVFSDESWFELGRTCYWFCRSKR